MKVITLALLLLSFTLQAAPAWARIGESKTTFSNRYGASYRTTNSPQGESFNIWYINGVSRDGKGVMFIDRKGDNNAVYDFANNVLTIY